MSEDELRKIPPVDSLLEELSPPEVFSRDLVRGVVRHHLDRVRRSVREGEDCPDRETLVRELDRRLRGVLAGRIRPVINATGVVLHTNLGRAPYARAVRERLASVTRGYCNLEIDLSEGERGGRGAYGETLLETITGAEAAAFVNNCSAALMLALRALAEGRDVLISRGELVQIGGGFRIPEILETSGSTLREVGTTNRTTIEDYREAMDDSVGMILKVHRSNFELQGFTEEPDVEELAGLAEERGVPLTVDLGSGALWNTDAVGLRREPGPSDALEAGASLVTASGDKLLGGPQAGLLMGTERTIQRLKQHPFFRAIRCGKATLAALEATLDAYLQDGGESLPVRKLLAASGASLEERARKLAARLEDVPAEVAEMTGRVGGGALPLEDLPDYGVRVPADDPVALVDRLRGSDPPVVAPLKDDTVELHLRTVLPDQDDVLAEHLRRHREITDRS